MPGTRYSGSRGQESCTSFARSGQESATPSQHPATCSGIFGRSARTCASSWRRRLWLGLDPQSARLTRFIICVANSKHKSVRSEEHTSELQSPCNLVCRLLLEKKKKIKHIKYKLETTEI